MEKSNRNGQATMQSKVDPMFYLVKDENCKIVICVGGYAVCDKRFDTFKQAEEFIATKPWQIIVNLCYIILNKHNNENKNENPQNK